MTAPQSVRTSALALPLLTISRLKAARSCLRLHKLRYLDGYKPAVEPDTTRFGSLMHRGLEAWWKARQAGTPALDAALDAIRGAGEADPLELAKAEVLMIGYDTRWSVDEYDVIAVEQEFVGEIRNPITGANSRSWQLAGKLDLVVRERSTGRVLIAEHKTSSENIQQGSEYWRRLRMDGQISTYFEGARILGYDVAGCLYDVIGKPSQRPLKATPPESRKYTKDGRLYAAQRDADETPQEYRNRIAETVSEDLPGHFQRGEVVRLENELHEALLDTWVFAQQLRESVRLGRAPRNPGACIQYGRTCMFFPACAGEASLDDPTRFVRSAPHPELTLPDALPTIENREGGEPEENRA